MGKLLMGWFCRMVDQVTYVVMGTVIAAGLVIGCAGAQEHPRGPLVEGASAGARLRPVWLVGEDGARMFSGKWQDSQLGTRCVLTEANVCMPYPLVGRVVFAADDCTGRAAVASEERFVLEQGRVFELGQQLPVAYQRVGQDCVEVQMDAGSRAYAVGDDVTEALVSFHEEV
jgi:hypothetical protein